MLMPAPYLPRYQTDPALYKHVQISSRGTEHGPTAAAVGFVLAIHYHIATPPRLQWG